MATPDLIVSRRKGEVLLNFQNETFESIMVVFHANALNPLINTLLTITESSSVLPGLAYAPGSVVRMRP